MTCAILDGHALKCWGAAPGYGDDEPIGDEPGEMGDALPVLDLGAGLTVVRIDDGANDTGLCAVLGNARIKCWGLGLYGNLARGDVADIGYLPGEMGDQLPFVTLLSRDW